MRLQEIATSRTEKLNIDPSQVLKLLEKHCDDALHSTTSIWRGSNTTAPVLTVDPSQHYRVSRNTNNVYNALFDGLPSWQHMPKRSQSLICSTTRKTAEQFGSVYRVFPYDRAKIAICPAADIWISFPHLRGQLTIISEWITTMMWKLGYPGSEVAKVKSEERQSTITYQYMTELLNDMTIRIREQDAAARANMFDILPRNAQDIFWPAVRTKSLVEIFDELLDPETNDFSVQYVGGSIPSHREIWTSSKCILVHSDHLVEFGIE